MFELVLAFLILGLALAVAVAWAKNMFDVGIVLVIFGMLFNVWFAAIGAGLIACHFLKKT